MNKRIEEKMVEMNLGEGKYCFPYVTILYDYIIEHRPKIIIELGTGHGATTTGMAMALRENNEGHIFSHDYYSESGWGTDMNVVQEKLNSVELGAWVTLKNVNAYDWLFSPSHTKIDMLYVDIHNDAAVIETFMDNSFIKGQMENGMPLFFEGSPHPERETVCRARGQRPFSSLKYHHETLYDARTGLSVIWGDKK